MSEGEFLELVGKNIRTARQAKRLSQDKLSVICGMEKASLSRLESGKTNPTAITLYRLSKALDVPVLYFFK